jgi:cellulose synthase (UDP-forming)
VIAETARKLPFRKRVYRGFEPALIIGAICSSILALGLFIIYVCWFTQMPTFSRVFYLGLLLALFYCCVSYQINRFGASIRGTRQAPFDETAMMHLFDEAAPKVTVLVPSYREERRVIIMTMLSAALAQYANRRIVLLVDDPPNDGPKRDRSVAAAREVTELLEEPMSRFRAAQAGWNARLAEGKFLLPQEAVRLVDNYRYAVRWLDRLAARLTVEMSAEFAHVDGFFIDHIVRDLTAVYRRRIDDLFIAPLDVAFISREYRRIATLFCTDIACFERKRFGNLSHAMNKAMNLNSYIGLMGGHYRIAEEAGGRRLEEVPASEAEFEVPATDYVLTLDADSVIRHTYMLELVDTLERHRELGVAQTPYLTFPGSAAPVERIAGATTDVQFLVHQGTTFFNAAYWVGANALIRFSALRAIEREHIEAGSAHKVFIQDETVIEDTGSTIDLLGAGWSVHNHFAQLAYSATPADFGALAIQRKRWSNGGLIILPSLLQQYLSSGRRWSRLLEVVLRANYLLSPAIGNVAVFLLMVWASVDGRTLVWTPLIMIPYFTLYGLDLSRLGYRFREVFAVCALNLMLLPVGFAGVGSSVIQMITGRKGSFIRTPKIADRTLIPPLYFVFNFGMSVLMLRYVVEGTIGGDYIGSIVPFVNVCFYIYGMIRFVGLADGCADLVRTLGAWVRLAYEPFARPVEAFAERVLLALALVPPRVLATAIFAVVVVIPWRIGPSLLEVDLARAAVTGGPNSLSIAAAKRPPSPSSADLVSGSAPAASAKAR